MLASDEALLERIARGDCKAFSEFYDRHAPSIYGFLVRLMRARSDADDVLQDTFWQIWRTADRFDHRRASPRAWLFAIARSRAVDHLRYRSRNLTVSASEFLQEYTEPVASTQCENQEIVARALSQLPEEQRHAIVLAFFSGHTHVEVARHLGIPLGTAKTRIALGMKRLGSLLNRDDKGRAK
jgi:RNA polymerase sigma-70 factor (ECF subfamily)